MSENRELAIRFDMLHFWLAGVHPRESTSPEKRDALVLYQRECARVLAEHFCTTPPALRVPIELGPSIPPPPDELDEAPTSGSVLLAPTCRVLGVGVALQRTTLERHPACAGRSVGTGPDLFTVRLDLFHLWLGVLLNPRYTVPAWREPVVTHQHVCADVLFQYFVYSPRGRSVMHDTNAPLAGLAQHLVDGRR